MPNDAKNHNFVEPLRSLDDIDKIKRHLSLSPKYLLLFSIGINSTLRVRSLLDMKKIDLDDAKVGDQIHLENGDSFLFNKAIQEVWNFYCQHDNEQNRFLFSKTRTDEPLKTEYLTRLVKQWCEKSNIEGNFGGQTLRKTFGYIMRSVYGVDIKSLSVMYGHACPSITGRYLDIERTDEFSLTTL